MRKMNRCCYCIRLIALGLLLLFSCSETYELDIFSENTEDFEKKIQWMEAKIEELEDKVRTHESRSTLESILKRGYLVAGINGSVYGFSTKDKNGIFKGLDVDIAKSLAAALFGDSERVEFSILTPSDRLAELQSGNIDVLCRNTSQTLSRETSERLNFAQVTFYDGQGFLVRRDKGLDNATQLDGLSVCVLYNTTTEFNASDYFRENNMTWRPVVMKSAKELSDAFFKGKCDCLTSDISQLFIQRYFADKPNDYMLLPEIISKEPLAPAVRHGDDQWFDIVNFTVYALITAEEYGITSKNVDSLLGSSNLKIRRFLGVTEGIGKNLGLNDKWAYNIVKQVGNYGEIFERNVGMETPLRMERGLNSLWKNGGLMYAPPFQ